MVHFVELTSNKKPTLTILDKEGDIIAEGVTARVDAPTHQPFRDSLFDNRLTDSWWSVKPTQTYRVQMGHHIHEELKARFTTIYILHPFPGSSALTSPSHHGWDIMMGKPFTLLLRQLLHTMLLGMAWGYSWPERLTLLINREGMILQSESKDITAWIR